MNKQELPRSNVMQGISTQDDDLEKHRERIRNMTDKQLLEHGRACRYMCTPEANLGKPPQESSVVHLREAREPSGREDIRSQRQNEEGINYWAAKKAQGKKKGRKAKVQDAA
jgi:hypothetical protein